ncbi:MAG TPA: DUF992 domain-containing protein [Methylocella sp.]|nr:DUF992 domain-containing protein [Methylocella sp.]
MKSRAVFATVSLALMIAFSQTASAQSVKIGRLRCNVSGGLGLIVTSTNEMRCTFTSVRGFREHYFGMVRKFGLDIGETDRGVLAWAVFAPTVGPRPGALAGDYVGVDASATIGAGLGANVLVGGSDRTIALQPLSVQAQTGLAIAGGVQALSLRPAT